MEMRPKKGKKIVHWSLRFEKENTVYFSTFKTMTSYSHFLIFQQFLDNVVILTIFQNMKEDENKFSRGTFQITHIQEKNLSL